MKVNKKVEAQEQTSVGPLFCDKIPAWHEIDIGRGHAYYGWAHTEFLRSYETCLSYLCRVNQFIQVNL